MSMATSQRSDVEEKEREESLEEKLEREAHDRLRAKTPEDARWFVDIILNVWPYLCQFVGITLKETLARTSAKMGIGLPLTFFADIDRFANNLRRHPLPLPLETSWVNAMIKDAWELIQPTLERSVKSYLLPNIRNKLPGPLRGIDIDPCTIGKQPPEVTELTTKDRSKLTADGDHEYVELVCKVLWNGDLDVSLNGPPLGLVSLGIKGIRMEMELHVCFMDMKDTPPFIGGISMWAVKPPAFMLDWAGMLNVLSADVVESLIHREIAHALSGAICLPHRIGIQVDPEIDIFRMSFPRPEGLLKLKIVSATGLRTDDFHLKTLWDKKRTCDPYVFMQFGARSQQTEPIMRSTGDAEWDETFYFLVDEIFDQLFDFEIFDYDLIGGDDPLARRRDVAIKDLLGMPDMQVHMPVVTVSNRLVLPMETTWTQKIMKEKEVQKVDFQEGHKDNREGPGVVRRALSSTGHALEKAKADIAHSFNKRTGLNINELDKVNSKLELEATWIPFEINETVARMGKPAAHGEPFNSLLFVGIYGCHDIAHEAINLGTGVDAADSVKYFAKVECAPHIKMVGKTVEQFGKDQETWENTPKRSKNKKHPKANMGMDTEEDKQEELDRKIRQLVDCGVPFDAVAEVLDVTPDRVFSAEERVSSTKMEHIDIIWDCPFQFLLPDPAMAVVSIQVVKVEPGMEDTIVGKFRYNIKDLLFCDKLTYEFKGPLEECEDAKTKIKLKLQLRTLFRGTQFPAKAPNPNPEPDPAIVRALARQRQRQRYIYLDRMGNERHQVNGLWVSPPGEDHRARSFKESARNLLHKEAVLAEQAISRGIHRASEAMHNVGDKVRHMFHKEASESPHASLADQPAAPPAGTQL